MFASRTCAVIALTVACAAGGPATLAAANTTTSVDLPRILAAQIAAVHRVRPALAVLVPRTLVLEGPAYASGGPVPGGYALDLSLAPRCHQATACFLAEFSAQRHAHLLGHRATLRLVGGVRATFQPLSCGASCSPPSISWVQGGVRYTMQFPVAGSSAREREVLLAAANAAIRGGPR